jgi:cullin 3
MKANKKMKHNELVAAVLKQLFPNFTVQARNIKIGIDDLIQREYMKRSEEDKELYEYIA